MKLILIIVPNDDGEAVCQALTKAGFFITKLATSGGFLTTGNTTLLIGTDEKNIPEIKRIVKENCQSKRRVDPSLASFGKLSVGDGDGAGAIVFVLNVEQFDKL